MTVRIKRKNGGYVAVVTAYSSYADDYRSYESPVFPTMSQAEKYAYEEFGARLCDFCKHIATNHFNASGNTLNFDSEGFSHDYYTCDACIPKVKEDIVWNREQREKKLEEKYGKKPRKVVKRKSSKRTEISRGKVKCSTCRGGGLQREKCKKIGATPINGCRY
jgi:hypothetical protein